MPSTRSMKQNLQAPQDSPDEDRPVVHTTWSRGKKVSNAATTSAAAAAESSEVQSSSMQENNDSRGNENEQDNADDASMEPMDVDTKENDEEDNAKEETASSPGSPPIRRGGSRQPRKRVFKSVIKDSEDEDSDLDEENSQDGIDPSSSGDAMDVDNANDDNDSTLALEEQVRLIDRMSESVSRGPPPRGNDPEVRKRMADALVAHIKAEENAQNAEEASRGTSRSRKNKRTATPSDAEPPTKKPTTTNTTTGQDNFTYLRHYFDNLAPSPPSSSSSSPSQSPPTTPPTLLTDPNTLTLRDPPAYTHLSTFLTTTPPSTLQALNTLVLYVDAKDLTDSWVDDLLATALQSLVPNPATQTNPHSFKKLRLVVEGPVLLTRWRYVLVSPAPKALRGMGLAEEDAIVGGESGGGAGGAGGGEGLKKIAGGAYMSKKEREDVKFKVQASERGWARVLLGLRGFEAVEVVNLGGEGDVNAGSKGRAKKMKVFIEAGFEQTVRETVTQAPGTPIKWVRSADVDGPAAKNATPGIDAPGTYHTETYWPGYRPSDEFLNNNTPADTPVDSSPRPDANPLVFRTPPLTPTTPSSSVTPTKPTGLDLPASSPAPPTSPLAPSSSPAPGPGNVSTTTSRYIVNNMVRLRGVREQEDSDEDNFDEVDGWGYMPNNLTARSSVIELGWKV